MSSAQLTRFHFAGAGSKRGPKLVRILLRSAKSLHLLVQLRMQAALYRKQSCHGGQSRSERAPLACNANGMSELKLGSSVISAPKS
jgi:hypothetical protein